MPRARPMLADVSAEILEALHELPQVCSGERVVAIPFIQSQMVDEKKSYLLYTLNEVAALEGLSMQWDNSIRLEHVRHSLHRMLSG